MSFWITACLLGAIVAGFVVRPLMRSKPGATPDETSDIRVYRDQMAEVERDLARGVLSPDEAEQTRTEVARRILAADKLAQAAVANRSGPIGASRVVSILVVLGLLGGALGIYAQLGAGGAADQPLAKRMAEFESNQRARPSQAEAESRVGDVEEMFEAATEDYRALVAQLRETAENRPDDLKGQQLLAQHEARLGRFAAAQQAQTKVIELLDDATQAADFTDLAELMIIAAGGYVSPEAERALAAAIRLDAKDPRARYYSGLDLAQNGQAKIAYRLWSDLLEEGPEDAPWIGPIRAQIEDVARMAGIAPPTTLPGPDAGQIEDAQDLSDADRQEFIQSMVNRLSERLANEGGSAEEWARLIAAYGVLGETERASQVFTEAVQKFAQNPDAMAVLKQAAQSAGLNQ